MTSRAKHRETLLRFARLASRAEAPDATLVPLAELAVEDLGADAAAVLTMLPDGTVEVAASRGLPGDVATYRADAETIDDELGERLLAACGGAFAEARTLPLVSDANLFGALVLLFRERGALDGSTAELAQALVDLAAITLGRAHQYAELSRSHEALRASREVIARTHKLRALGQMAAGVSHDLKNILNPLSLHLELLRRGVAKGHPDAEEAIAEMRQILKRGVETLERLRDFSRQAPETHRERADLDQLVSEAAEISRPRLASGRRRPWLIQELGAPAAVDVQAGDLVAALVNLVVNAVDALQESGSTITLRTGESGGRVWVSVADDGPGMTPEVERRVFEPFFTTKGQEGTGLGLANVYAFAQRHGATLTLETSPGLGATFTLSFPPAL